MKIVPVCSSLLSALVILACSDAKEQSNAGTDSGTTTSGASSADGQDGGTGDDGSTGSGGGGSDTSTAGDDGSTGSGGTSGSSDAGTTTSDSSNATSDTGHTTSGTSTTSGQASVEYVAFAVYGGLDRIFIRKADHGEDRCLSLVVAWPAEIVVPFPDVTTPDQWAVETISVSQGTTGCVDPCAGPGVPGQEADTASGDVDFVFNQPGEFPDTLDMSVTMTFPPGQPWIPAADSMDALDLPVETCP